MKIDKPIIKMVNDIIEQAITDKTPCYITIRDTGIRMYSYQDKLGYRQRLEYYSPLQNGKTGNLFLELITKRGGYNNEPEVETREGSFGVEWEQVHSVTINEEYNGRYLIKIDKLEINFLR